MKLTDYEESVFFHLLYKKMVSKELEEQTAKALKELRGSNEYKRALEEYKRTGKLPY